MDIDSLRARLAGTSTLRPVGKVVGVTGLMLRVTLPGARIGDVLIVHRRGEPLSAEVVGFADGEALVVPLGELSGVGPDDLVESTGAGLEVGAGDALLGRVLDGLMTLGVGQRVGLFAGSGVGKSTLLGAIARGTSADVVVVALVGERGREVSEFLDRALGEAGRARSVVVVATSDAPPVERLRAAQVATAIAEYFRDAGKNVMLLVDSVTRVARAQREIGLAAGEPPARRGYPPSVFALLPRLLERSGQGEHGAITAIYTVLVEGGDMDEPIADEVRGILDGHIVLERQIAARGHYPAVDAVSSLSRVMDQVVPASHVQAARKVRSALALYEQKRDLIALGAYEKGSDPRLDQTLAVLPELERFLCQDAMLSEPVDRTRAELTRLAQKLP